MSRGMVRLGEVRGLRYGSIGLGTVGWGSVRYGIYGSVWRGKVRLDTVG